MRVSCFVWDTSNAEHVIRHRLHPDEVDETLNQNHRIVTSHSGRYVLYGRTDEGRYLYIVFQPLGGQRARVVTARDMTESERKHYYQLL